MYIKCWGSRGSISVAGKDYLKYGGTTTCMEIRARSGETIIVDAGTGIRRLGNRMIAEAQRELHMLFTHAHWDHSLGFPFFKPLYRKNVRVQMHECPFHNSFVETILTTLMKPPYFPVAYAQIRARIDYEEACPYTFQIGSITIDPIPLSHPNGGSGYKFSENGKSFVFLTDNELGYAHQDGRAPADYEAFSRDADLLIHDAEYIPAEYASVRGWGHSVFTDTVDLAMAAGVKTVGLFHLNQDRTDAQMDAVVADARHIIKEKKQDVECVAVGSEMVFEL